jgi:hypothetical protein
MADIESGYMIAAGDMSGDLEPPGTDDSPVNRMIRRPGNISGFHIFSPAASRYGAVRLQAKLKDDETRPWAVLEEYDVEADEELDESPHLAHPVYAVFQVIYIDAAGPEGEVVEGVLTVDCHQEPRRA